MTSTPYIGYTNDTLERLPRVRKGDRIRCPHCGQSHVLQAGTDLQGRERDDLLWYRCEEIWLAAVDGRLVIDVAPDARGEVEL